MSVLVTFILIFCGATTVVLFGSFCVGIWRLLYEACCVKNNPPNIDVT